MPGETAAPNTTTGKTGTPDPQPVGLPFTVTVNAVDEVWNVLPSTDTVDITSSDSSAGLPADAALVNGTASFTVYFGQPGTWTVTATDVTDSTKTANTGSPTVAQ
jgi:nucleoid-associated protein YgaU